MPPFLAGAAPAIQRAHCGSETNNRAGHAVSTRTVAHSAIQKMTVGATDDPFEREADRMADRVMRMPDSAVGEASPGSSAEPCSDCRSTHEKVQKISTLQANNRAGGATDISPKTAKRVSGLRGGGRALPPPARQFFEPRFGRSLGDVRIHTGRAAEGLARELSAQAFTVGRDIVFGAGQYSPASASGKHLLAHELTHTIQQRGGATVSRNVIMRRWDRASAECAGTPPDRWLRRVVVEQETPQSVTLHWSDGSIESGRCSSGKGHCCVDPAVPEGVACSVRGSQVNGSNCTPITERNGYAVRHRDLNHRGSIRFWTEFVPSRGIALHAFTPVDGTPLSHGCVRLDDAIAKKIFCGARQNRTNVQVQGFARPICSWPGLRTEWLRDFAQGGRDLSAFDGDRDTQSAIRETRRMLNESFGRVLTVPEIRALTANDIPVCGNTGARPTPEEQSLTADIVEQQQSGTSVVVPVSPPAQGTVPARILANSTFNRFLVPFTSDLSGAGNLARARRVVRRRGRELWRAATQRAQASTNPNLDDRPLFWARLQMARALRQWSPRFSLTGANRTDLLALFERASRGMDTVRFRRRGVKRILISGFDPFELRPFQNRSGIPDIRHNNPSGAAALALDGRTVSDGTTRAEIQGVVFPVRFADFDAGIVENLFRPFIDGTTPVDMIMTISQGGSAFEVERFAGRRRSLADIPDNSGQVGGGTPTSPAEPPMIAAGPEFLRTTLPAQAIRGALGRTVPLTSETEVDEIPAGGTQPVNLPAGGPTAGSTSVEGSGGGFLSNEIFYRTALLRHQNPRDPGQPALPVGHLHVPKLNLPPGTALTSSSFEANRQTVVDTVEAILKAALPTL